jgi:hypothetical protein
MMDYILKDLLVEDIIVYIDKILIYTKHTGEYDKLAEDVLGKLAENEVVISSLTICMG